MLKAPKLKSTQIIFDPEEQFDPILDPESLTRTNQ